MSQDVREYKETLFRQNGFELLLPLWGMDSKKLIKEFIGLGYEAYTVCVDTQFLDVSFLGRKIDEEFVNVLPESVDPCGENGEYHSFVWKGPIFMEEIPIVAHGEYV
jgi:diphthamide synthase (EF-2-diphthine--ammonia ligase)